MLEMKKKKNDLGEMKKCTCREGMQGGRQAEEMD